MTPGNNPPITSLSLPLQTALKAIAHLLEQLHISKNVTEVWVRTAWHIAEDKADREIEDSKRIDTLTNENEQLKSENGRPAEEVASLKETQQKIQELAELWMDDFETSS